MATLREFAGHRLVRDWDHSTAARVREEYQAAGYHRVKAGLAGRPGEWQEIHQWCCDHIGEQHYSWTGSTFWFETREAAAWFALHWS